MAARPDTLVLCYHGVSDTWPASMAIPPATLRNQLERLVRRGWRGETFTRAVESPRHRTLVVTFDDAYTSVLTRAGPILDALDLPATVFVPTAFPDGAHPMAWDGVAHWHDSPHADEMACLTWDQLRSLAERGWEIGSHTCTHPHLPTLDDETLARELAESRARIESALGRPCTSIAYPYGDHDDRVVAAAAAAGYVAACTLPGTFQHPMPLRYPRVGLYREDGPLRAALKVSPLVRRLRAGPAGELLTSLARR